jgi:tetratricopeptide (TPR) repeat protein
LLFIHGLGGTAKGTWGRFPEFIEADPELSTKFRIGYFAYPTSLIRLPFLTRPPKIQDLASGLRNQIENRYVDYKEIALVCHSLGGLIARKYLIDETKNKRPTRVTHLALLAVPNNGAQLARVAQYVSWQHNQLAQLCQDSDLIEFLNEDWFLKKLHESIPAKFFVGTQDRVVTSASAKSYWGNPDIETIVGCGHRSIVKPASADDDVFITLKRFLVGSAGIVPPGPGPVAPPPRPAQETPTTRPAAPSLPTKPSRFLGRKNDLATVVGDLTSEQESTAILVLGGPGLGKTTLTRQAANDDAVVARFGRRRWFVELETAKEGQAFEQAVVSALGLDPATKTFDDALPSLAEAPGLLILDNLETPWEAERAAIEALLARLHQVPALALLTSIRGNEPPGGLRWTRQRTVQALESPDDRLLFLDIAKNIGPDDPHLGPLLKELGGVPLAVELVAYQSAPHDTLAAVYREWQRVGTALAQRRGVEPSRLTALDRSLELSVDSSRLGDTGRRLFSILGQLPAGISAEDLDLLLKEIAFDARQGLLASGLGFERSSRLDLLPPVRDHARRSHAPTGDAAAAWWNHYLALASFLNKRLGTAEGGPTAQRLAAELPNLDAALRAAIAAGKLLLAILSCRPLAITMSLTGVGTTSAMRELSAACRVAGNLLGQAESIFQVGYVASGRSDYEAARQAYEQALPLFRQVGNIEGEASCIQYLGDIALARSDLGVARAAYQKALLLYRQAGSIQGEANCTRTLGDIALARSELEAARKTYDQAAPLFQKVGDLGGEAACIAGLAQIALERAEYDAARKTYEKALKLFEQVGDLQGAGNCIYGLGDTELAFGDYGAARKAYERALPLFQQTAYVQGEANCIRGLADVALRHSENDAARKAYEQALALYERISDPSGIGYAFKGLAQLSAGHERTDHIAAARQAWLSIDRADLVRTLDQEFGT